MDTPLVSTFRPLYASVLFQVFKSERKAHASEKVSTAESSVQDVAVLHQFSAADPGNIASISTIASSTANKGYGYLIDTWSLIRGAFMQVQSKLSMMICVSITKPRIVIDSIKSM